MKKWIRITGLFILNLLCLNIAYADNASVHTKNDPPVFLEFIFLATNQNMGYPGNLGGISGADAKCNSSSERPSGNQTYKALILYNNEGSDPNQERYPCTSAGQCGGINSKNWVLQPNTTYYNTSDAVIGTTNSDAIFTFPLSDIFSRTQNPMNNVWIIRTWTGALQDWTPAKKANCLGWTDMDSWNFGANGNNTSLNADAIGQTADAYGLDCHLPLALYCVSQPE